MRSPQGCPRTGFGLSATEKIDHPMIRNRPPSNRSCALILPERLNFPLEDKVHSPIPPIKSIIQTDPHPWDPPIQIALLSSRSRIDMRGAHTFRENRPLAN
ncbi:hypothetical protein TNIN_345291 [Trichonephila inaurata madagascariensis]|uniref:Uncharacterized protein n=1 Tax=Trichonephila inaurata madagascariensis TaxID=2747483 RepID=A0A8X6XNX5_9ARAC|nr:hypothetical protein TNIN_345291 [Trichonephila inaurata madagascariensis]